MRIIRGSILLVVLFLICYEALELGNVIHQNISIISSTVESDFRIKLVVGFVGFLLMSVMFISWLIGFIPGGSLWEDALAVAGASISSFLGILFIATLPPSDWTETFLIIAITLVLIKNVVCLLLPPRPLCR